MSKITISSGLFDNMVLQRAAHGRSNSPVSGSAPPGSEIFLRIGGKGAKRVARASASGEFSFNLTGLKTGGPYAIEIEARDGKKRAGILKVKNVLVGDVWLAAGQSNMEGIGQLKFAEKPHPQVRAFYMTDRWAVARDPIHKLEDAVDAIHHSWGAIVRNPLNRTGPAVGFAAEMHRKTKVPQGIIACAHGGTSMDLWNPALRDQGGNSLYGAMIRRLNKNGGKAAGLIWYQGESDAYTGDDAQAYGEKTRNFIRSLRADMNSANLPIVLVQISRSISKHFAGWNVVQEHQRRLPETIRRLAVVPGIDLKLDDTIHIGWEDNNRLGRRMARAMLQLVDAKRRFKPPIALRRCSIEKDAILGTANVVAEFDNVEGALQTDGGHRANGFKVTSDATLGDENVYDIQLSGNRAIVRTFYNLEEIRGRKLHYGYGTNPFCNIVDAADRSLPVFGPVEISE